MDSMNLNNRFDMFGDIQNIHVWIELRIFRKSASVIFLFLSAFMLICLALRNYMHVTSIYSVLEDRNWK